MLKFISSQIHATRGPMKVTQEKLPASQIGLEIEIPPEMSQKAYEKALKDFTRSANIPGFRKGKVPRQVLIQRFGANRLKAVVIEDLIENGLKQAVEQEKIEAIGSFELRSSFEDLLSQFEPGSALIFSAAVDVPPEVKLSRYQGLQVQAEEVKYDPARVDKVLEDYRGRSATLVPVEGRSAQQGDAAVVDFVGRIVHTTEERVETFEEIQGGSAEDFQIDLEEGKFIPGFIDGILGMNPGETKEVSVEFPQEYAQANLAGKSAVFTITLKELKEKELPELDDDFAQEISDFETLAELRTSLEARFQQEAEQKTKANKEQALLEELVKYVEAEIPETLTKREADYMVNQIAMQLSQQGLDIKQLFTPELVEQLRQESRPEAITRIKRTLALGEVAKQESLKVESSAIATQVKQLTEEYKGQNVDPDRIRQVVEEDLLKEKILNWLEEHGQVELVPEGSLKQTTESEIESKLEVEPLDPTTATIEATAETVLEASELEVSDLVEAETLVEAEAPMALSENAIAEPEPDLEPTDSESTDSESIAGE
jgi:trigger factor